LVPANLFRERKKGGGKKKKTTTPALCEKDTTFLKLALFTPAAKKVGRKKKGKKGRPLLFRVRVLL